MPSPFPGMDPYLEGYLWTDFHNALASKIRGLLAPKIQPKYTARLELHVVADESEVTIMYPDVEIFKAKQSNGYPLPLKPSGGGVAVAEARPTTLTAPVILPLAQVRLVTVEIHDVAQNLLITSIEILSPVNKREPNLSDYRRKRAHLREAGVHLLELDLLRRGTRVWTHSQLPPANYYVSLTRAGRSQQEVWPIQLADKLPIVAVPLHFPDEDVLLDLGQALTEIYDEAFYHLSIDYTQEPSPPLDEAELAWVKEVSQSQLD